MITKELMDLITEKKLVEAKDLTNTILLAKVDVMLDEKRREYALDLFSEAKKAKVTDKDDDGEGMDPVGQEDDDVDNDGDSDSSDKYLKNRRKVVTKAVKQDEQVGARSAGMQRGGRKTYGVRDVEFKGASPEQQSRMKSRYYQDKERQTREAERERKQKQREKEAKQRERGVRPT